MGWKIEKSKQEGGKGRGGGASERKRSVYGTADRQTPSIPFHPFSRYEYKLSPSLDFPYTFFFFYSRANIGHTFEWSLPPFFPFFHFSYQGERVDMDGGKEKKGEGLSSISSMGKSETWRNMKMATEGTGRRGHKCPSPFLFSHRKKLYYDNKYSFPSKSEEVKSVKKGFCLLLPLLSRKCFPAEKKGDSDRASCCFFSSFFFLLPPLGNIGAASVLGEWASILVYLFYLNSPSPPPSDTEKRFPTKKKEKRKRKPSRIFSFIGRGRKVPFNKIKIGSPRKSPLRLSSSSQN